MSALQPVDFQEVWQYLRERNLVDERHLPYYIRRLQRFFAGPGGDSGLVLEDARRLFLERLEQEAVPEWQVGQAARAVELHQKHYLRHKREQGGDIPAGSAAADSQGRPVDLATAMNEVRQLVRLRHYAYRTEETHLGWLSGYQDFVAKCGLPWDTPDTARAFLAELAPRRGVAASTQNQAFSALLVLPREVVGADTAELDSVRAKRGPHLPVVLTEREVALVLAVAEGAVGLTLRHSFATDLPMRGVSIREVQEYLGHKSVVTTMIYTRVMRGLTRSAVSPLDAGQTGTPHEQRGRNREDLDRKIGEFGKKTSGRRPTYSPT